MNRDLGQQTAARLAQEWSAPRAAAQLQPGHLEALAKRFEGLEPLAKARALLAGTFMRAEALAACRPQLQSIAEQAIGDDDEWVRVIGRAVGDFSGSLDLDAVVSELRLVAGTMAEINRLLDEHKPCPAFRPLEELYLSPRAAAARGGGAGPREHSHFRLRRGPAAASTQDIAAAALPTVPAELSINISNQAGYSEKLGSREETVAVSTAAAAPSEAAPQKPLRPAAEQLPMGLLAPLRSPRDKPAAQEVDMFLSSKPVQRPAADRRVTAIGRKARTKQIDIQEVAALNKSKAEEAATRRRAAEKQAAEDASRRAANGAQPGGAAPSEKEDITGGTQPRMPSLADYMGGGSSSPATAAPRQQQRQDFDDRQHAHQQQQQHQEDFGQDAGYGDQDPAHQQWQGDAGWQHEQAQPDDWQEQHRQRHDPHQKPQDAHWQRLAPQHQRRQDWDPRSWVDHDAAGGRDAWVDHGAAGGRDAWVDHDAAGGRDAWVDHDAAGGRDGWVDHDAMGGRGSRHSRERSGGASADAATHYSASAGRPGGPEAAAPQGADSEPESGEVEAEEGELQPSPAKRQRVDQGASDDGGWTDG